MIILPIDYSFRSVGVDVELWNRCLGKFSICKMVFDTGAWMTTIDESVAKRSGYSLKGLGEVTVMGIGGADITAKQLIVDNLRLGGLELGAVVVNVMKFPDRMDINAVLGMNIIKEFKVEMNFASSQCQIRNAGIRMHPTFDTDIVIAKDNFILHESRFGIWSITSTHFDD